LSLPSSPTTLAVPTSSALPPVSLPTAGRASYELGNALDLRRHIQEVGFDEAIFIADGQLVAPDNYLPELMYLLNEDLFTGGLTQRAFRSDRKSPR